MKITMLLDQDGSGKVWDDVMSQRAIPDVGSCTMVTKAKGTEQGRAIVSLVLPVVLPDGRVAGHEVTFTAREFVSMAAAVSGCHPGAGSREVQRRRVRCSCSGAGVFGIM